MIGQEFIFSDHALKRFLTRFKKSKNELLKDLSYCNKEEITKIKNTKSYKSLTISKQKNIQFYKNEKYKMFLICEKKLQSRKGQKANNANIIITLYKKDEIEKQDLFFEMVKKSYEMKLYEEEQHKKHRGKEPDQKSKLDYFSLEYEEQFKISFKKLKLYYKKEDIHIKVKRSDFNPIYIKRDISNINTMINNPILIESFKETFFNELKTKQPLSEELISLTRKRIVTLSEQNYNFDYEPIKPNKNFYKKQTEELLSIIKSVLMKIDVLLDMKNPETVFARIIDTCNDLKINKIYSEFLIEYYVNNYLNETLNDLYEVSHPLKYSFIMLKNNSLNTLLNAVDKDSDVYNKLKNICNFIDMVVIYMEKNDLNEITLKDLF